MTNRETVHAGVFRFLHQSGQVATCLCFLLLLVSPLQAEDWPTFRGDSRRSGVSNEKLNVSRLKLAWTVRSQHPPQTAWGGPAKWDAYAGIRGLRDMRNYDRCFPVVVVGDSAYFGSSVDDTLRCFDVRTGKRKWIFFAEGPIRVSPTISAGRVYFGADDGFAYCLDAEQGRLLWKFRPPENQPLVLNNGRFISKWPCRSGVTVIGKTAYMAFSLLPWQPSWICALDAKTGLVTGPGRYVNQLSGKTLEAGILATGDRLILTQGRVEPAIFDRKTGRSLGSLRNGGGSFLMADITGIVFHGPGNKTGWVVESDGKTRKVRRVLLGQVGVVTTPSMRIDRADRMLKAIDQKTGAQKWNRSFRITFDHIVVGETVFIGGDNEVIALAIDTGQLQWRSPVKGKAMALAVANGRLFVSTHLGHVHCFEPGKTEYVEPPVMAAKPIQHRVMRTKGIAPVTHPSLIHRWVFRTGMNERARRRGVKNASHFVPDLKGSLPGQVLGTMRLQGVGGIEALVLDGSKTSVRLEDNHTKANLPTKAITAEAWVRIDKSQHWGGIIGAFQDNGNFERGWLLGYVNDRFSFALTAGPGSTRLIYLTAKTPFSPGRWYHVVGTWDGRVQRLYVNGQLANEDRTQQGEIQYPKQAFVEIGAYHDKDEYFRMTGMLHDVRLYNSALKPAQLQKNFVSGRSRFPQQVPLATGPWVRFTNPHQAVIQWKTASPSPTQLRLISEKGKRQFNQDKLKTDHSITLDNLQIDRTYRYVIKTKQQGRTTVTPEFELETHFNYSLPVVYESKLIDEKTRIRVRALLRELSVRRGICFVLGCSDGKLLYELARQSRFRVITVEENESRVNSARRFLKEQGVYGTRVTIHSVKSFQRLPFCGQFANLVIVSPSASDDNSVNPLAELFRITRPNGGTILLNSPSPKTEDRCRQLAELPHPAGSFKVVRTTTDWLSITRNPPFGAGEWSHLYGKADNSAFGTESLGDTKSTGELQVQWFGLIGPRAQADRNGRKPSPLAKNGRLFVQGLHRIAALDSFNGSILWSLEIPDFERFNMPRDCGNWCIDDRYVFAAIKKQCWQIDAQTGKVVRFHQLPTNKMNRKKQDWGHISRLGNTLLGSSVKQDSIYTNFWGKANAGWYDSIAGPVTYKICSDRLFALNANSGGHRWSYSQGVILNSTITATKNRVMFLECRNSKILASQQRRIGSPELWKNLFLVTLDLQTGKPVWQQQLKNVKGDVAVFLAASEGRVILSASSGRKYHVQSFSQNNGKPQWRQEFGWPGNKHDHGKALSRPAIANGRLFLRPKLIDLATGKLLNYNIPSGGCGTYACTTNMLLYRNGSGGKMTFWDHESKGNTSWDRLRPGCWLSTIPANGMLLSPEAGGGCSCGKWLEASFGFVPNNWEATTAVKPRAGVKKK